MDNKLLQIEISPIRQYAESYAKAKRIPQTQAGMAAYLTTFGEDLCGGMEKMLKRAMELQAEMTRLALVPPTRFNRITEVVDGQ